MEGGCSVAGVSWPVLPRLRADLPPEWVLAEPPPIPDLPGLTATRLGHALVALRCADHATDAEMVAAWMSLPHLAETWQQAWPMERWMSHLEAQLAGTYSVPAIVLWEGAPVGYVEIYRAARDEVGRCYRSEPHDMGFHIAVGRPELTGRGRFSPLLPILADALMVADRSCEVVVADPDVDNVRMHRALSRHGWQGGAEIETRPDRRIRLFHRTAAHLDPANRGLLA